MNYRRQEDRGPRQAALNTIEQEATKRQTDQRDVTQMATQLRSTLAN